MIHLYSGDGKGKTSIAVGMAIRMAGAGGRVIFAQFMKGNESSELNILTTLPQVRVLKADKNFGFYNEMSDGDKNEITACHNEILRDIMECVEKVKRSVESSIGNVGVEPTAEEYIADNETDIKNDVVHKRSKESSVEDGVIEQYREGINDNRCPQMLVVLDEITYPCRWHLIDEELVRVLLKDLPDSVELVMTGRDPLDYMIELSDYWSDVDMKRHPYERGVSARLGVEF